MGEEDAHHGANSVSPAAAAGPIAGRALPEDRAVQFRALQEFLRREVHADGASTGAMAAPARLGQVRSWGGSCRGAVSG